MGEVEIHCRGSVRPADVKVNAQADARRVAVSAGLSLPGAGIAKTQAGTTAPATFKDLR